MPELPEVETVTQGIKPLLLNQRIKKVTIRHPSLRWPIDMKIPQILKGHLFIDITRRGKYILLQSDPGTLLIHLGMSGSLRVLSSPIPIKKHDHIDIEFENNTILRFNDPRRFGAFIWTTEDPNEHPLLNNLGIEPLNNQFNGTYLFEHAKNRKTPIKSFIMNSHIVVGVGNIYATESLFLAGINPLKLAGKISLADYEKLAKAIKQVLKAAIKSGGTTLKDFNNAEGKPGYFSIKLKVYGRENLPCSNCKTAIQRKVIAQRSTYFCPSCQQKK